MKKIVHATDYSENAVAALKYAFSLSKKLSASLFVIHVFDYSTVISKDFKKSYLQLEEETYKIHYEKLVDFCKKYYEGDIDKMDVSFYPIEDKSIVHGIMTKANKVHADLIVLGTKGEKFFTKLFLGNTAKYLIEKATCPILTVPKSITQHKLDTIVYASDFEASDIKAIYNLINLVKPYRPAIKIVHISTKEDYKGDEQMNWFLELLKEKVLYHNIDAELLFSDTIFNSLKTYLTAKKADMVVMLERNSKGFLKKIFHADLVKKMESLGSLPLMSFNQKHF